MPGKPSIEATLRSALSSLTGRIIQPAKPVLRGERVEPQTVRVVQAGGRPPSTSADR